MAAYLSVVSLRRIVPLLLTLTLVAAMVFFTSLYFNGLYKTAVELVGDGRGVLIVYSADAKTPQTSIIPLSIYDKVSVIDGVEDVSPEVIAIALAGDHAVIVRGVDPSSFQRICGIRITSGLFELNNSWSAIIGRDLARLLGVNVGDRIILRSVFTNNFLEVIVRGVFESGSSLDSELIVPIYAAQWLRGLPRDAISLLRVRIDEERLSRESLLLYLRGEKEVEKKSSAEQPSIIRLLTIPRAGEYARKYAVKSPEESMKDFLERSVRMNETVIWGILIVIISGCVLLIYLVISLVFISHSRELTVLSNLGASKRGLTLSLVAFVTSLSALSTVFGFVVGGALFMVFSESKLLLLGPYIVRPSFSFDVLVMLISAMIFISAISAWFGLNRVLGDGLREG